MAASKRCSSFFSQRDLPDFEGCIKDVAITSVIGGTATPVVYVNFNGISPRE